jgi:hypothetical protein
MTKRTTTGSLPQEVGRPHSGQRITIDDRYEIPRDIETSNSDYQGFAAEHLNFIRSCWRRSDGVFNGHVRLLGTLPFSHYHEPDVVVRVQRRIQDFLLPVFNGEGQATSLSSSGHGVILGGCDAEGSLKLQWSGRIEPPRSDFSSAVSRTCDDPNLTFAAESAQIFDVCRMDAPGTAPDQSQRDTIDLASIEFGTSDLPSAHDWTTTVHVAPALAQVARVLTQHAADPGRTGGTTPAPKPSADTVVALIGMIWKTLRVIAVDHPEVIPAILEGSRNLSADLDAGGSASVPIAEPIPADVPITDQMKSSNGFPGPATDYLTISQAAKRLGMDKRNVRYYIDKGALEVVEFGPHSKLILRDSFEKFERQYIVKKKNK